jgi:hypothetical protein
MGSKPPPAKVTETLAEGFPKVTAGRTRCGNAGSRLVKQDSEATSVKTSAEGGEATAPRRAARRAFPGWARWAALAWMAVWFPVYWRVWGAANFVHLCDIAVILTCVGFWIDSPLLISSQAVSSLIVDTLWAVDAICTITFGRDVFGSGTEYLVDPSRALWVRLLTLYHVVIIVVLLCAVRRAGYDKRGWALQSGIAAAAFMAARFTPAALNINFAYQLPVVNRPFGPAPLHVAASVAFMIFVVYWPTHWLLRKLFATPHGRCAKA